MIPATLRRAARVSWWRFDDWFSGLRVVRWLHRPRVQRAIAWAVRAWVIVGWLLLIPLAVYLHGGRAA